MCGALQTGAVTATWSKDALNYLPNGIACRGAGNDSEAVWLSSLSHHRSVIAMPASTSCMLLDDECATDPFPKSVRAIGAAGMVRS